MPGPAGEIPLRVYCPKVPSPAPALIYFHDAAVGCWATSRATMPRLPALANSAACVVISVDYRLGPEHKFPAAVDDSYAATCWIADHAAELGVGSFALSPWVGTAPEAISLPLCPAIAEDRGGPSLAFQLLIYPGTDMRHEPSIHR